MNVVRDPWGTVWVEHHNGSYWYEGFTWRNPAHIAAYVWTVVREGRVPVGDPQAHMDFDWSRNCEVHCQRIYHRSLITGIRERHGAGEPVESLMFDYELDRAVVESIIRGGTK